MIKQRRLFQEGGKRRRGYGWKKGTDEHIKTGGKFAERLAQHLLGGVRSVDGDDACDLWREDLDLGIESKMGSNRDGVRIKELQLDSHLETCEEDFPYSQCWYIFLKYLNASSRREGQLRMFQASVHSEADVHKFLAENTTGFYVLDISVVDAIRNCRGTNVVLWRRGGATPAVRIGWRFFRQLVVDSNLALSSLGLNPRRYTFESRRVATKFEGHTMIFEFQSLLCSELLKRASNRTLFPLGVDGRVAV